MGLYLIAFISLSLLGTIVKVAVALGFVIFVHELGHFAVAKLCGVKCEKFYLGFDIGGLKLCKFQWGETEYGIGILPLGGYVKMLGQEDNPNQEAAENERAKVGEPGAETLDPRSYKAQSVPRRMAIISAGVVMNLIFACVFAAIACLMGFKVNAAGVSHVFPGEPAWRADMRPGDQILAINGQNTDDGEPLRFRDLTDAVILGNLKDGVEFKIKRDGVEKPFLVNVRPAERGADRLSPTIGVSSPMVTTLAKPPARKGTPTADLDRFAEGDKIVSVAGEKTEDFTALTRALARYPDGTIPVAVERTLAAPEGSKKDEPAKTETIEIEVPPTPMKTLGLVMKMGPISAVQENSPAEQAGLEAGDMIVAIDGQPVGDPLTLPDRLAAKAGETLKLQLVRALGDKLETIDKEIIPRQPDWFGEPSVPCPSGLPLGAPALGIAYRVENVINAVQTDSPAAAAELVGGSEKGPKKLGPGVAITKVEITIPEAEKQDGDGDKAGGSHKGPEIEFSSSKQQWPVFHAILQELPPGSKVKLTTSDGSTTEIEPFAANDWFNPDRGLDLTPDLLEIRADSFGQAITMGIGEARYSVTQVYRFLRRLGTQISVKGLGGPVAIAQQAGAAASQGLAELLLFLTMLSANLAVINFLPIPILDGGHMVFLILEGVLKRPVNERVVIAFHYAGFLFIISLMIFVLGLDLSRWMSG